MVQVCSRGVEKASAVAHQLHDGIDAGAHKIAHGFVNFVQHPCSCQVAGAVLNHQLRRVPPIRFDTVARPTRDQRRRHDRAAVTKLNDPAIDAITPIVNNRLGCSPKTARSRREARAAGRQHKAASAATRSALGMEARRAETLLRLRALARQIQAAPDPWRLRDNARKKGQTVRRRTVYSPVPGIFTAGGAHQIGVEPKFETYTGDDPLGELVSVNYRRGHG
jgi:hypothetical protein